MSLLVGNPRLLNAFLGPLSYFAFSLLHKFSISHREVGKVKQPLKQQFNAFAVSADATARVWDMEIGDCVLLLGGHTGPLTNVAAAADGSFLITTSSDGSARLWELEKGECLAVLLGHTAAVSLLLASVPLRVRSNNSEVQQKDPAGVHESPLLQTPCIYQVLNSIGVMYTLPVQLSLAVSR